VADLVADLSAVGLMVLALCNALGATVISAAEAQISPIVKPGLAAGVFQQRSSQSVRSVQTPIKSARERGQLTDCSDTKKGLPMEFGKPS